ncbi:MULTISPECIES: Stk1 family PASTA domain-containing Ser/Thr kinase [unclassified Leifsonia]|uniref:Stk1 family PASTA domain-containing Ser/Thr kinase n=1 Tax=unclassified Leifsonia TaxID=2663824 RepID=UPI0006FE2448|nr:MULTISPECIES: Stk1 family PASTA domain-containing Ser/Thr kinase [unclassified Leifsonia]KQX06707.1 serine/threonine protein kinase [Leifsonia sp. Root1293]KRA10991.1 serine/threonine protein kinase [Leifsonia sp. Root60]
MTVTPTDPMLGRLIDGRYQVRSRIARGGMATVYLATDLRLERRVAVKIMHGHLADDNTFKSRFVQEARSAARLAHPNVVNVFDQGQDSDMAYMVMEYLPGITLRDLLKDYGRLTPEQTIDIMSAVLSGLAAAHKAGIVHRDMKPENVLLADDGRIKLGDFGLARAASANTATGQALLGTIAYLSPELVTRGVADARSDIYALGIMMYEMLTGEQPFVGEAPMQIAYQHANEQVPRPSSRVPTTPRGLDDLVVWATARDPENRPRDARIMLERLRDVEKLVRDPAAASAEGVAPTMVLPSAPLAASADDETQIITPTHAPGRHRTGPVAADASAELATATVARARRGYWLFALVLILAGLAGATGWYFGAGPGSLATVPDVVGQSQDAATAALVAEGFTVKPGTRYDLAVAKDLASGTDPKSGSQVTKGSAVVLYLSLGAEMLEVPAVAGSPEADARTALARFTVGESIMQFSGEVDKGLVIAALDGDGAELPDTYPDAGAVTLVVSAGGLPPLVGMGREEAKQALLDVDLVPKEGDLVYSDTVPEGDVVAISSDTDPIRVGDTITLTMSKGVELFEVPDVSGMTINEAAQAIEDAGFTFQTDVPELFRDALSVNAQDPAAGEQVPAGTTVSANFSG